jgi:hypothetical protein
MESLRTFRGSKTPALFPHDCEYFKCEFSVTYHFRVNILINTNRLCMCRTESQVSYQIQIIANPFQRGITFFNSFATYVKQTSWTSVGQKLCVDNPYQRAGRTGTRDVWILRVSRLTSMPRRSEKGVVKRQALSSIPVENMNHRPKIKDTGRGIDRIGPWPMGGVTAMVTRTQSSKSSCRSIRVRARRIRTGPDAAGTCQPIQQSRICDSSDMIVISQ